LANNSVTINGSSVSLGGSVDISAGTDWQSVVTADGSTATTASAGEGYFIDTTSNAHTINLPASPTQGDEVTIVDYAGTFGTNNVTVGRNGSNVDGVATDAILDTNRLNVRFVYIDATQGWKAIFDDASTNYGSNFITATGGTVTESGDFKIHTFTGDGCFVVSGLGSNGPCAQNSTVDYMVIAGGGGGSGGPSGDGGGGGGAGGFRESKDSSLSSPHCASPLAATTGLTISATTYPITVGAGGTGTAVYNTAGNNGSNSVFSTITSTGGGGGGGNEPGNNGGSGGGGGAGGGGPYPGGSGNTPPVSPPQGNSGSTGAPNSSGDQYGGGGGGATQAGQPTTPATQGGPGGNGATTSISGSPVAYAGGGGGMTSPTTPTTAPGGTGGGGSGSGCGSAATSGTTNRGAGGGGAGGSIGEPAIPNSGGNGGKGIVVIRYKFQ
jgi:hypothetical protein